MEKELENIKNNLTNFIEKYKLKTLKINTKIGYHSKFDEKNSEKWILEYYSTVEKIDINLTK